MHQCKHCLISPFLMNLSVMHLELGLEMFSCKAQPIAYYSKSLGPKAAALSTYEKEAIAILESLRKWRHYFLGSSLLIKTNHQSLKFITEQRISEGIQDKLMLKLL